MSWFCAGGKGSNQVEAMGRDSFVKAGKNEHPSVHSHALDQRQ